MARKSINRPSSLYELRNVKPRLCRPVEWRANFKMRRIRMMRKICTTRRTSWNWSELFLVSMSNSEMKYGKMASKSITFSAPLKNFHLLGEAAKRSRYSSVNHVMHTASTVAKLWLSIVVPATSPSSCSAGSVLSVRATVDSTMNRIEITATTWESTRAKVRSEKTLCFCFFGLSLICFFLISSRSTIMSCTYMWLRRRLL